MTDYVLDLEKETNPLGKTLNKLNVEDVAKYGKCFKYAVFLKQPLKLEMFVPCDDEGNVLEDGVYEARHIVAVTNDEKFKQYQQAKEKVLFKGCRVILDNECNDYYIEINGDYFGWISDDLPKNMEKIIGLNLELTEAAQKQL